VCVCRAAALPYGFPAACQVLSPSKSLAALDSSDPAICSCVLLLGRACCRVDVWGCFKSCVCVYAIGASLLVCAFAVGLRHYSEACVGPLTILGYSMACWRAACFPAASSTRRRSKGWTGGVS